MSCPICGKPTLPDKRPFCSRRCADVDLAQWLNGAYAVPSQNNDDLDDLEQALRDEESQRQTLRKH